MSSSNMLGLSLLEEYMHGMFLTLYFSIMKLLDAIYGFLIIIDCLIYVKFNKG